MLSYLNYCPVLAVIAIREHSLFMAGGGGGSAKSIGEKKARPPLPPREYTGQKSLPPP